MLRLFAANTADDAWQHAAEEFRSGHGVREHCGRGGDTQEMLHVGFSIENPRQRWVTSRHPAMNPAFAVAEVIWIMMGRDDAAFLGYWNKQYQKFAGDSPRYYGAYGHRLRKHFAIDQIDRAYAALSSNPKTRQVVWQIWDVNSDFPDENGLPRNDDIPCNVVSLLKVREGKLEWLQVIRSNDLFLGVPHNFVQFTCLQEILAGWLGLDLGSYNQLSDSLHVYTKFATDVEKSLPIGIERNTDSLAIPRETSVRCIEELARRTELFVGEEMSPSEHERTSIWEDAPTGFRNLLGLLGAEGARKRGWDKLALKIMSTNTNPSLNQLWHRWLERLKDDRVSDHG